MLAYDCDGMDRNVDVATVHFHGEYAPPFISSCMRPRSMILIGSHEFFSSRRRSVLHVTSKNLSLFDLFRRLDAVHANDCVHVCVRTRMLV